MVTLSMVGWTWGVLIDVWNTITRNYDYVSTGVEWLP
jgi:hypothetical protein